MKVTATAKGFADAHLKEPGMEFQIPDTPTRKLVSYDDAVTRGIASKKGDVPVAFASGWMRPGWESEEPRRVAPASQAHETDDSDEI